MLVTDTMSTHERLGKIMEDFRTELKSAQQNPPLRGTHLVNAIVDRLVTNHVDLDEVSLWDMKRLISDAAAVKVGRSRPSDCGSPTAS